MRTHLSLLAATLLLPLAAAAQEWRLQTYHPDDGSPSAGSPWAVGILKLSESGGRHRVHAIVPGGGIDPCWRAETGATVERQPDQLIIYMEPLMAGCLRVRFVLKADGTGGHREDRQPDGTWKHDGRERLLTRK